MAVVNYQYRIDGGTPVDVGNVLTYQVSGLMPSTAYNFEVRAQDGAGNFSAWSNLENGTTDAAPTLVNYALASNGATASASSDSGAGYAPQYAINGLRHTNNAWGAGGGWDASLPYPQWLEVDFSSTRSIYELDYFTLADALNYNTNPALSDTFTLYGDSEYKFQYWNGSSWVDISGASVTGNNNVWRHFAITPVSTNKIRAYVTAGLGRGRIVELEAWGV